MFAKKALAASVSAGPKVYVEDVFSTYLYTGNASTQTITNGIDLSGEGGLVWIKDRQAAHNNFLFDTSRGVGNYLLSDSSNLQGTIASTLTAFNSNGFSLGSNANTNDTYNFASWTFRKAEKFFDVVTYSGNGTAGRQISHNLGSVPGVMIVKVTSGTGNDWQVYHRSLGNTKYLRLNTTDGESTASTRWNDTTPTSTYFVVGNNSSVNATGSSYVAYLFAHDAGGFGDAGDQSVISCGSLTTDGSGNATVTLGWEPQLIIAKKISSTGNWIMYDTMRGWDMSGSDRYLFANSAGAEATYPGGNPTPTGFYFTDGASSDYIYIAIRRGPMKTPEAGTEVFSPNAVNYASTMTVTTGFPVDLVISAQRGALEVPWRTWRDRLRGNAVSLRSENTNTEGSGYATPNFASNTNIVDQFYATAGSTSGSHIYWNFRRAPGFFDEVCYTGNGGSGTRTINHNLTIAPELLIIKTRTVAAANWVVGTTGAGWTKFGILNSTTSFATADIFANTAPTSSVFSIRRASGDVNESGRDFVAYLFASVTGVSKVGSYTGNGSSVTVTTGFQPRFVMVKRTDSTGNWIVGDSARGLVASSDPYVFLNATNPEDTDEDWVDVSSTGFTVNQTTASNANVNTATYIYLAIA